MDRTTRTIGGWFAISSLLFVVTAAAHAATPKVQLAVTQMEGERTSFSHSEIASVVGAPGAGWTLTAERVEPHAVRLFVETADSRVPLELPGRRGATVVAVGIRRMPSGTLIVAGEQVDPDGEQIPCLWLHQPGTPADDWVKVVLSKRLIHKKQRKDIARVLKVVAFEHETEELILVVKLGAGVFDPWVTVRCAIGVEWTD